MQEAALVAVIEPILAEHQLELDRLEITPIGKRTVLRVTVDGDGPEGTGPLLDDIAAASRAVSEALDVSPAVGNASYTLEVSSRGVSRPLVTEKHFRRNLGRLVKVNVAAEQFVGRVTGADEAAVDFDVNGTPKRVGLDEIVKAVVQVELNRALDDDEGN